MLAAFSCRVMSGGAMQLSAPACLLKQFLLDCNQNVEKIDVKGGLFGGFMCLEN